MADQKSKEWKAFDRAMQSVLHADPKAVKAAMEAEKEAQRAEREAKGERKRGRKPRAKK